MEKFAKDDKGCSKVVTARVRSRNWMFEVESYPRLVTLVEVSEDLKLKRLLKRAVGRDQAAPALIESIRAAIRR